MCTASRRAPARTWWSKLWAHGTELPQALELGIDSPSAKAARALTKRALPDPPQPELQLLWLMASEGTKEHPGDSGRGWWMISFPPPPISTFLAWRGQSPSLFPNLLPGLQAGRGHRWAPCTPPPIVVSPSTQAKMGTILPLTALNCGECVSWIARWSVWNSSGLSHTEKIPGGGYLRTRNEDSASFCRSSNWTMMTGERLECHLGNIYKETCAALREEARQLSKGRRRKALFSNSLSVLFVLAVYSTVQGLIANCSDKAKSSQMRWAGRRLPAHPTTQPPAISGLRVCKTDACPPSWVVWNYAVVWWSQQITRMNHTGGNKKAAGIVLVFRRQ